MERQDLDLPEGAVTDFFRIDANVLHDGRILDAADSIGGEDQADALALYVAIWSLNRLSGQSGRVSTKHLCRAMRSFGWGDERTFRGIDALGKAGLLKPIPGVAVLSDWDDFWYCGDSADERRLRSRNKKKEAAGDVDGGGRPTPPSTPLGDSVIQSFSQSVSQSDVPSSGQEHGPDSKRTLRTALKEHGMASNAHIAAGVANLVRFEKPTEVLRILEQHVQRFATENRAGLLAKIVTDADQIDALIQEAEDKATGDVVKMSLRMLAKKVRV